MSERPPREHMAKPKSRKVKRAFATQQEAEEFARLNKNKITAYQCRYCHQWHVGGNRHGEGQQ